MSFHVRMNNSAHRMANGIGNMNSNLPGKSLFSKYAADNQPQPANTSATAMHRNDAGIDCDFVVLLTHSTLRRKRGDIQFLGVNRRCHLLAPFIRR
jgi:hypothetical protein